MNTAHLRLVERRTETRTKVCWASPVKNNVLLRDMMEDDLPIFFGQQLDPDANCMAAFRTKDPADRDAFTAHWSKIFGRRDRHDREFDNALALAKSTP